MINANLFELHFFFLLIEFLDDKDASLAGIIYGASQFRSFPVAIFQVSSPKDPAEYLMCFHGNFSLSFFFFNSPPPPFFYFLS